MESKLGRNLQEKLRNLEKPVYIVFPEAYTGNVQDALIVLKQFSRVKPIPLSKAMIGTGSFDSLIDSFCPEFHEITYRYFEKQVTKGRYRQEDLDSFDLGKARELLREPLNLALMMVKKGYADAEVGGFEIGTPEHVRRGIYIVNKDMEQENIVCSATIEFLNPHKIEDKEEGILREQRCLTIVDPGLGKSSMEYGFLTGVNLLNPLYRGGHIPEKIYQGLMDKIREEKAGYIQSKVDQALSALRSHYVLTNELAVGAFITHSTAGSDEHSPYIHFIRGEVIPAIVKALEDRKQSDPLLQHATFISEECQVEAASDPRIGRKEVKEAYAGFVNVHVCDSLVSANQHYTTFLSFGKIASVIRWIGFQKPIYDISRSFTVNDVVVSSMMAAISVKEPSLNAEKERLHAMANEIFSGIHTYHILAINPGSTSTKVALFRDHEKLFSENLDHSAGEEQMPPMEKFDEHVAYRLGKVEEAIRQKGYELKMVSCVMGRGGLVDPLKKGGVYAINDLMLTHLKEGRNGMHASNLGAHLATQLAQKAGCEAYIADPIVIDEQSVHAKVTGIKGVVRESIWHALNQKYVARRWAEENKKSYHRSNIIVVHMGGGLTAGAHKHGMVVDVNNGLNVEGVFAMNRSGCITPLQAMKLQEKYGKETAYQMITRKGGFHSLLNTNDFREVLKMVQRGEPEASTYYHAFVYQLSKQICGLLPAFYPEEVDQVIFTGGMAYSSYLIQDILRHLPKFLSERCSIYPGEYEMEALAYNGLRVLRGVEKPSHYKTS